jgi:hypothetical protein
LPQWSLDRVRKANEPKWDWTCPELSRFECADLYGIKGRHKISSDLSRFLLRYGVGRILFTGFKGVFQRAPVLGRASVSELLN